MQQRSFGQRLGVFAIGAVMFLGLAAAAQAKVQVLAEDWGLGGAVKSGVWSPLYLELQSTGGDFEGCIEVRANAGQQTLPVFIRPISLVSDTPARYWMYYRTPASTDRNAAAFSRFSWQIVSAERKVVARSRWRRPVVMPCMDSFVAVLNTGGAGQAGLGGLYNQQSEVRVNVKYVNPSSAPDRWIGYEPADVLIWLNPDPSRLTALSQQQAIRKYVRNGGHLVVATGSEWQSATKSFLGELLPAEIERCVTIAELPSLRGYGMEAAAEKAIDTLVLRRPRGTVLMEHGGRPLIVRGRCGLGRVTLVGFDPTRTPFSRLARQDAFWQQLLRIDTRPVKRNELGVIHQASSPTILSLNDFPNFQPINFFVVGAFLFIYVILIGPVDYFVLKRLKKLHWTWVTFPTIAIVSSLIAFLVLSSGRVVGFLANSVSIVDAAADGDEICGTTFTTMLSPRPKRYTVSLGGVTSGGIIPREFNLGQGTATLTQTPCSVIGAGAQIVGMRIRVWDAQTLEAHWNAVAPELPTVQVSAGSERITVSLANTTAYTLHNACLIHNGRVASLGTIKAGESKTFHKSDAPPLPQYVAAITPKSMAGAHVGFSERTVRRADADNAMRWLSLFPFAETTPKDGKPVEAFKRLIRRKGENFNLSAAFDLSARLQLEELLSHEDAVLLYGLDKSLIEVNVAGGNPRYWNWTLVRLRIPVHGGSGAPHGEGP